MDWSGYRELWVDPRIRRLFIAAFFARMPAMAAPLAFTLHIVQDLDGSYGQAGVVAAATTVGAGLGAPWRGRLIDRLGMRRAITPSIIAVIVLYPLAVIAPYWALIPLAFFMGLFLIPIFSIMRQSLSVLVPEGRRRVAFSADSVVAEASFIIGPASGIFLVTQFNAAAALAVIGACEAVAGVVLWRLDPPVRSERPVDAPAADPAVKIPWMTPQVGLLFLASAATVFTLVATDLGIVAVMEDIDNTAGIALAFGVWGAASLIGGLLYGALHTSIRPTYLLLALGLTTIPVGLAHTTWVLVLAVIPTGMLCAPTMTAAAEWITKLTPEERRGEAMGWHGTAFTAGIAIASPVVGLSIDHVGSWGGFAVGGAIASVVAVVVWVAGRTPAPTVEARSEAARGGHQ